MIYVVAEIDWSEGWIEVHQSFKSWKEASDWIKGEKFEGEAVILETEVA